MPWRSASGRSSRPDARAAADGRIGCRWHLLPYTDYLAWDGLIAIGTPPSVDRGSLRFSRARPVCAQLLRVHHRPLAGLLVLGAGTAGDLSPPGRHLADRIARDEAVALK